jgi:hypothetical protein
MDALKAADNDAKVDAWLRGLSDEQLKALIGRQNALHAESGDPEATLSAEHMAEALGMTVAECTEEIERRWRESLGVHKGPLL